MNFLTKISFILLLSVCWLTSVAQTDSIAVPAGEIISEMPAGLPGDTIYKPDIIYSPIPKVYEIAGLKVEGINHVDDYIVIANSGLSIGERVEVPGPILTAATKRLWRQGLYSSVKIYAEKAVGDKIWLVIYLKQQPRLSEMRFEGA